MAKRKPPEEQPPHHEKPVSLVPIPFEEAVADLMKVKPPERKGKAKSRRQVGDSRTAGKRKSPPRTRE